MLSVFDQTFGSNIYKLIWINSHRYCMSLHDTSDILHLHKEQKAEL